MGRDFVVTAYSPGCLSSDRTYPASRKANKCKLNLTRNLSQVASWPKSRNEKNPLRRVLFVFIRGKFTYLDLLSFLASSALLSAFLASFLAPLASLVAVSSFFSDSLASFLASSALFDLAAIFLFSLFVTFVSLVV